MRILTIVLALCLSCAAIAAEPVKHRSFASAESAVAALGAAVEKDDRNAMAAVLGDKGMRLVRSGDTVIDKAERLSFLRLFRERHTVEPESERRAVLVLGEDELPFPVPLVASSASWKFDGNEGHEDLLSRRIGKTERIALDVMQMLVRAQRAYFKEVRQPDGRPQYAGRVVGDAARRDGLAWMEASGKFGGPLGESMTSAYEEGYRVGTPIYIGYRYRLLDAQGPGAPGGAKNYVVDGHRTGGFAAIACPVRYAVSGVLSYMTNQDGIVYHKDLGKRTAERCKAMTRFDPDRSWTRGASE